MGEDGNDKSGVGLTHRSCTWIEVSPRQLYNGVNLEFLRPHGEVFYHGRMIVRAMIQVAPWKPGDCALTQEEESLRAIKHIEGIFKEASE